MGLRSKQSEFVKMVGKLIIYAESLGYELTFGDAFRDAKVKYGNKNSLHRIRLAIDFNLFIDGMYKSDTESHKPLGVYWESIGGSWGGRFKDGNHYSYEHDGRR